MGAVRWVLIAGAVGIAVAALVAVWRAPAEGPVEPGLELPVKLPLTVQAPSSEPTGTPSLQPPPAVPPSAPPPTATTPMALTAPAPPRIGSEGYGPHIDRALLSNDADQAWDALTWMQACNNNEALRQSAERLRGQGTAQEFMTQRMVELDEDARRCQTITAQHRALVPELAARAMRAGIPTGASTYGASVAPGSVTPAVRQEVGNALRRDALTGDTASLLGAITSNEGWGLTDAERLSYLVAFAELQGRQPTEPLIKSMLQNRSIPFKTPPTPEQWAAADTAGKQIAERIRAASATAR